ncbi:MAG: YdcF family protein [SAR324 cluster bacterium]|nr:YdcF family protein [SAR324 cluster bacterium]
MFFYISKIITFLIDPLTIILFLLLFFILKGTKRFSTRLFFYSLFLVLFLASTNFFADSLLYRLEHVEKPSLLLDHYDAVIVLTGMTHRQYSSEDRIEFSDAVDRILAGISLVKNGKADFLLISGGDGSLARQYQPEARILEKFSLQWGLKKEQILIDDTSRNTYENAVESAKLIQTHKMKKLLLITSAFHMVRSRGCFKKMGLDVDIYPVDYLAGKEVTDFLGYLPSSVSLAKTNLAIHELVGIFVYGITGRAAYTY